MKTISDKDLYSLCKQYGKNARQWTRKFAFLLPEVLNRGLHKKYGYQGINEFAAKLCGMSAEVVERILWLHRKLVDKPLIWEKLEIFGWTKLRVVARVIEADTEKFWLDKLERLTYSGLVEYVQAWKKERENSGHGFSDRSVFNGLIEGGSQGALEFMTVNLVENCKNTTCPVGEQVGESIARAPKSYKKFKFNLDVDTEFRLKKVKKELEKTQGAVTFGETLNYVLKKLEELEKVVKGSQNFQNTQTSAHNNTQADKPLSPSSKPLPRCLFPGCNEPYDEKHHPFRVSLSPNNKNLTPLCRKHHQLAHSGLIENEKQSSENWKLQTKELPEQLQYYFNQTFTEKVDSTVRKFLVKG